MEWPGCRGADPPGLSPHSWRRPQLLQPRRDGSVKSLLRGKPAGRLRIVAREAQGLGQIGIPRVRPVGAADAELELGLLPVHQKSGRNHAESDGRGAGVGDQRETEVPFIE